MQNTPHWRDLLKHPVQGDHVVQTYPDPAFLAEALAEYAGAGLEGGEAIVIIATAAHWEPVAARLEAAGHGVRQALARGQLNVLDAEQTLARVVHADGPDWKAFQDTLAPVIGKARLRYSGVRACGDMVDLLLQQGNTEAAVRLEGYWNDLSRALGFTVLCAYHLDALDPDNYSGRLQSLCACHTHLIPARDYWRFNRAVREASKEVLDQPLAQMALSLAARHRPATQMPLGQVALFWLRNNMPGTASRVLSLARLRYDPA